MWLSLCLLLIKSERFRCFQRRLRVRNINVAFSFNEPESDTTRMERKTMMTKKSTIVKMLRSLKVSENIESVQSVATRTHAIAENSILPVHVHTYTEITLYDC